MNEWVDEIEKRSKWYVSNLKHWHLLFWKGKKKDSDCKAKAKVKWLNDKYDKLSAIP